jgi:hypothetical protein
MGGEFLILFDLQGVAINICPSFLLFSLEFCKIFQNDYFVNSNFYSIKQSLFNIQFSKFEPISM